MTRRKKRFALILSAFVVLGSGLGLVLYALRDNIVFFYGPSEILAKDLAPGTRLRIGGLVKHGSLTHAGMTVHFAVTDGKARHSRHLYRPLPDLFREGQGVVAEGVLDASGMTASTILAKHDERYMPREVVDALKKAGRWQENAGQGAGMGGGS